MFQLDDKFLEEVGLGAMPQDQRKPFLQYIYNELELRVGTRLSEGMSDEQLAEFESIIDKKDEVITPWIERHAPNFREEPAFQRIQQATQLPYDDPRLKAEFAATKWLEVNRPDYRNVVASVLAEIKQEITSKKDAIISSFGDSQPVAE